MVAMMSALADCVRSDTKWRPREVAARIVAMGYAKHAHVGKPELVFEEDEVIFGEWIVGQSIDCMEKGMPPHPVSTGFAAQYAVMD